MTKREATNNLSEVDRKRVGLPAFSRQSQRIQITFNKRFERDPALKITPVPEHSLGSNDETWTGAMHSWRPKAAGIIELAPQLGRSQC